MIDVNTRKTPNLLPCPFCGGEANGGWFAISYNIDCECCKFSIERDRDDAGIAEEDDYLSNLQLEKIMLDTINAWNTRPDISPAHAAKVRPEAIEALANYSQGDMDGIMVLVSRQAIEECLTALRAIALDTTTETCDNTQEGE